MKKQSEIQKVFNFNPSNQQIRVELVENEPYFVAKDVCDALGLENNRKAIMNLDADERLTLPIVTAGQHRHVNLVNESGLYALIFQSRKPQARAFRKWVTSEVLPAIRRTGTYRVEQHRALTCYTPDNNVELMQDFRILAFDSEGDERGYYIPVVASKRSKTDKFMRIEGMSDFFERRNMFFNEAEKDNSDQVLARDSLLAFEKGTKIPLDFLDALQGGTHSCSEAFHHLFYACFLRVR